MAYSDLGAISPGDTGTSTWANQVRANFQAGVPDIFTTKGDLAGGTGTDAAARLGVGADDATLVADASAATGLAWQIQPACAVYNSTAIDPATSTWVALTFDTERYDTNAMHDTVTNTERLTVPANGDGIYTIGANAQFVTNALTGQGGQYGLRFLLNGTTVLAQEYREQAVSGFDLVLSLTRDYALSATDYVTVQVYTTQDVNVGAAGNYSPEFWATWQRR